MSKHAYRFGQEDGRRTFAEQAMPTSPLNLDVYCSVRLEHTGAYHDSSRLAKQL
jgi:hypothetical protein